MKYYIATAITNMVGHNALRDEMNGRGHKLTYDWTSHGSVQSEGRERIAEVCMHELFGIVEAAVVIVLLPGGRGTHTELGIALGLRKPVLLVGASEAFEQEGRFCSFYFAPTARMMLLDERAQRWDMQVASEAEQIMGAVGGNSRWVL